MRVNTLNIVVNKNRTINTKQNVEYIQPHDIKQYASLPSSYYLTSFKSAQNIQANEFTSEKIENLKEKYRNY